MLIFLVYAAVLIVLAARDIRHSDEPRIYFLNGRSSGMWGTGVSILASCIGASATIGMAGLAWQVGTPAFWWLGSGVCGLVLLTVFLARKIRESEAYTMPELVSTYLGSGSRTLVSCIIIPAWLAILAAQFTAMGKMTAALTGLPPETALIAGAVVIVLYSCLGGQASVIRSDLPQGSILMLGLAFLLGWLLITNPEPLADLPMECFNETFGPERFSSFMIFLGGSYVVCPMLFGRLLSSRDIVAARRGCWLAVFGLMLAAVVVVLVGILSRGLVPESLHPDDVLPMLMTQMPPWLGTVLLLSLLSAVLSSADSCIITASTVLCNDLFRCRDVRVCRLATVFLGALAFVLCLRGHGILELLLMANDIYVCGVVVPVFVGMIVHGCLRLAPGVSEAAIVLGGIGGLLSSLWETSWPGYLSMGLSVSMMLFSAVYQGKGVQEETVER